MLILSCKNQDNKNFLIKTFDNNLEHENFSYKLDGEHITRYDDKGFLLDKHWFDKEGNLTLYTFYNRFYDTDRSNCKIKFNQDQMPIHIEGRPFYVSSNLIHNDTIYDTEVKAYIYLANSPFLDTKVAVSTKIELMSKEYLMVEDDPSFVVYFEDSIGSSFEEKMYDFIFSLNMDSNQIKDTIKYNSIMRNN